MNRLARLDLGRLRSVARKELLHILRDRMTLFFALFIPIVQLTILGFAIDTNVRHVRTMVYDRPAPRRAGSCCSGSRTPRTSGSWARSSPMMILPRPWFPVEPGSGSRSPRTTRDRSRPVRRRRC